MEGDEFFCDYYKSQGKHDLRWQKTTDDAEIWKCAECGRKVEFDV